MEKKINLLEHLLDHYFLINYLGILMGVIITNCFISLRFIPYLISIIIISIINNKIVYFLKKRIENKALESSITYTKV